MDYKYKGVLLRPQEAYMSNIIQHEDKYYGCCYGFKSNDSSDLIFYPDNKELVNLIKTSINTRKDI
jgi:hypothetical protein